MGWDIHAYVESQTENGEWEWYYEIEINDRRRYALFGFLIDVCNLSEVPSLSKPRGLPKDVSAEVKAEYKFWRKNAHCPSYLMREELLDFDYDKTFEDRRNYEGRGLGPPHVPVGQGVIKTFREFLPATFFEDLLKLAQVEAKNVRLVFWFDY